MTNSSPRRQSAVRPNHRTWHRFPFRMSLRRLSHRQSLRHQGSKRPGKEDSPGSCEPQWRVFGIVRGVSAATSATRAIAATGTRGSAAATVDPPHADAGARLCSTSQSLEMVKFAGPSAICLLLGMDLATPSCGFLLLGWIRGSCRGRL